MTATMRPTTCRGGARNFRNGANAVLQPMAIGWVPRGKAARGLVLSHGRLNWPVMQDRPILLIGRAADNDIRLTDQSCSRYHAYVQMRGGRYFLVDQSLNGTTVRHARGTLFVVGGEIELPSTGVILCGELVGLGVTGDTIVFDRGNSMQGFA
jgi:hypothetical protein